MFLQHIQTETQRLVSDVFQVAQLHHELNLKDELLQFYTNAAEESEDESNSSPTLASCLPLFLSIKFWIVQMLDSYKVVVVK